MPYSAASATMSALNRSDYAAAPSVPSALLPGILGGIALLIVVCLSLYVLHKRIGIKQSFKVFFQDYCASCRKPLRKAGIKKSVNFEGTLLKRRLAFCSEQHLQDYVTKWGEPLGCCAACMKAERFSIDWWIYWARIAIVIGFIIAMSIILLVRGL